MQKIFFLFIFIGVVITSETGKYLYSSHLVTSNFNINTKYLFNYNSTDVITSTLRGGLTKSISIELKKKKYEVKDGYPTAVISYKIKNWSECGSGLNYYYIGILFSNYDKISDKDIQYTDLAYECEYKELPCKSDKKTNVEMTHLTLGVFNKDGKLVGKKTIKLKGLNASDMGVVVLAVFTLIMIIVLFLWLFCYCRSSKGKK